MEQLKRLKPLGILLGIAIVAVVAYMWLTR